MLFHVLFTKRLQSAVVLAPDGAGEKHVYDMESNVAEVDVDVVVADLASHGSIGHEVREAHQEVVHHEQSTLIKSFNVG